MECANCREWGRTITPAQNEQAIACPKCGRLTWPSLGVNLPAGAAVAMGGTNAVFTLLTMERRR
jgi:hypothetical protein